MFRIPTILEHLPLTYMSALTNLTKIMLLLCVFKWLVFSASVNGKWNFNNKS
tara:strand:+ start:562 stop:717 length:156 start_codon:yes stop_codon:yes gene_type:complete